MEYDLPQCFPVQRTVRIEDGISERVAQGRQGCTAGGSQLSGEQIAVNDYGTKLCQRGRHGAFAAGDGSCQSDDPHRPSSKIARQGNNLTGQKLYQGEYPQCRLVSSSFFFSSASISYSCFSASIRLV